MTKLTLLLGLVMRFASVCCKEISTMKIIEKWQHIDYDFPSVHDRHFAIGSGLYAPGNVTPIDVDVDYRGPIGLLGSPRIFVTTPRFTTGIPVTLGYVVESKIGSLIHPYPDYSWHSTHGHNCSGITSAFRVAIDACNYLWVLDSGVIGNDQKCPPQLLVFDLFVDTLIHRYKFPKSQYKSSSLLIAHILDTNDPPPFGSCADTKVYIADATAYGLIVYDNLTNKSWRIENRLFYPDPNFSTISVAGESFELMDGIFNFALSPRKNLGFPLSYEKQDNRFLFFHALASGTENSVPLRIINDPSIWEIDENALSRTFRVIGSRSIQTPAEAMDSSGNLFFVLVNPMALVCWDSSTPYTIDNIKVIYRNDETLQFASGVKIVRNAMGMEELWVITNRFQRVYTGKMDLSEVNFRIQTNTVAEMLKGSSSCNADKPIF